VNAWKSQAEDTQKAYADHATNLKVLHDALGEHVVASKEYLASINKHQAALQESIDAHKELNALLKEGK
jgi:hypothetical protein